MRSRPSTTKLAPVPGQLLDPSTGDALLTTDQAAALLGISPRTLEGYRRKGGGPLFVALSRNAVRYRPADLKAWLDSRTAPHTAKARVLLAA
ncbi:helix-turn-helix domain-containing protein [Caulobacter hibisci]|uniref:Helix-turn-helix domain-containing protein n=2 Tax=Caulobacter hibisci TaxID=2035993 RepID=A0ABS0T6F6_9CAUL|nr:helix-turn-helix domain-containing protein [Caulobacter hibisci]